MAEKQLDHRIDLEARALTAETGRADRGQIFAFVLSALVILVCALIIMTGHPIVGLAGILVSLATLASLFVYVTKKQGRGSAKLPEGNQNNGGSGG